MITSLYDPAVERVFEVEPREITTPSGVTHYPFQSPQDWRDLWIYFLLVDRFNNPTKKPASADPGFGQYQGGTFEGIRQQLPYLKNLGVGALWLSPVLMNPQWFKDFWGGYCIMDFMHVEPRFCKNPTAALKNPEVANEEFRSLVDEIHANGMYVILDIVLNHTADVFNYEGMRDAAPYNNEREYGVYWRDDLGIPHGNWTDIAQIPNLTHEEGIWPTEFQRNSFFRRRGSTGAGSPSPLVGDFDRLKELVTELRVPDTDRYPVRDALIRVYQYLIGRFDLDGYRIDTLQYVETDFARVFGNATREYALSIGKKNFFTFGEVWQDEDEQTIAAYVGRNTMKDGEQVGVEAAIDFPMRKHLVAFAKAQEAPVDIVRHFERRKEVLKPVVSSHGEASRYYVTFLDNHDLNERITVEGYEGQTAVALTCLMAMQGVPAIYYGTEQGLTGRGDRREYVREALWGPQNGFRDNHPFYKLISSLEELRSKSPALRYGRQYFRPCSGDGINFGHSEFKGGILAFSRILNDREILVVSNASTTDTTTVHVVVDWNLTNDGDEWEVLLSTQGTPQRTVAAETHGACRTVPVTLPPMAAQVLARKR
jgi:glycosidase